MTISSNETLLIYITLHKITGLTTHMGYGRPDTLTFDALRTIHYTHGS